MNAQTVKDLEKFELWNEFKKMMGSHFIGVLEYHIGRAAGMPVDKLILFKPKEFMKLFIQIFGLQGWSLFISVMLRICHEKKFEKEVVYKWFGIEEPGDLAHIHIIEE